MPARIEDVASKAGVSTKTVSRVFNREPNVSEKARLRVEAAARELNYRPNPSARSLAGNRSYLVALLFDNPHAGSSYVMELIVGVLQACENTHYNAMLRPLDLSADPVAAVEDFVAKHRPDALVLAPPIADDLKLLQRLDELGVRYSAISARSQHARIGVGVNERKAATDMVEHLVALGHRRIAHIAGRNGHGARAWRLAGYREGLRKAGIDFDETLIADGDFSFHSGIAAARRLLDLRDPPTAIFAANDDSACGAMHEAFERGLSIPRDLSICGFDNTPASVQVWPSLTTVHQPCREMGRIATEQVLLSIRDPDAAQTVRISYEIMIRGSTGPVPMKNASVMLRSVRKA
jgi:LacI family transcriptional regulator